jgi:hypothetical protein
MSFASRVERLKREHGLVAPELAVLTAADFLHGGAPAFARAVDRKGALICTIDRRADEGWSDFRCRVGTEAKNAALVVIGGVGPPDGAICAQPLPRGAVTLPDIPLHVSQRDAIKLIERERRTCLICGRRWGKSTIVITLAVDYALMGRKVGVFAPTFRLLKPLIDSVVLALGHLPGAQVNRSLNEITLKGGGCIKGWSLDFTGRAARGQGLHLALVDEAAHDEGYLASTLEAAIMPALLDYAGKLVLASTPNGLEGAFWEAANVAEKGYMTFHAPTSANPHLPASEIQYLRSTMQPEIASQELDALFVDIAGSTIFPLSALLIDNEPHPDDGFRCDHVGVAVDSNSGKGGPDRDGAAAVVFAVCLPGLNMGQGVSSDARVVIVDWDIQSLAQGHSRSGWRIFAS